MARPIRLLLGTACLLLLASGPAVAATPTTLEEARSLASERGTLVLLDLFATWCGPCKVFDRDAHQNPETQAALERVVLFKLDGESPAGRPVALSYGLTSFPTYVLLTPDGETVHQWAGYNPKIFIENLEAGLANPVPIEVREERFGESGTAADALVLATWNWSRGEIQAALEWYEKAGELNDDPEVDYSTTVFVMAFEAYRKRQATADQVVRAAQGVLRWEGHTPVDALYLARYITGVARNEGTPEIVGPFLEAAFDESAETQDAEILKLRKGMALEHALYVDKDADAAVRIYKERLPQGWEKDAKTLNAFAWWCFENRIHLEEAETHARSAVDLAPDDATRAMILDTLAEICLARGRPEDSVRYMEAAIEADPERDHYRQQLERFRKELSG